MVIDIAAIMDALRRLALGAQDYEGWFDRHLVAPRPLLLARGLIT
jgi:hypothetical protein